jgi:hypothetical protein
MSDKLDRVVAEAQRNRARRELGYREQALKLYPWVCGRCAREFTRGSNWELLCVYCHDNEHARYLDDNSGTAGPAGRRDSAASHNPFAGLDALLKQEKE